MAITDDSLTMQPRSIRPEPRVMANEHVGTNGHARTSSPNELPGEGRGSLGQRSRPQQGQKAGAVNGKDERRFEQPAPDRQAAHPHISGRRNGNVARRNRSVGSYIRPRVEAVVDVLNIGWGAYLAGLVLMHFLI